MIGRIVRIAVSESSPSVAVISTGVGKFIPGSVSMVKVAVFCPSGIVTDTGMVTAEGLLLDRLISAPPGPAGFNNCTLPVEGSPALTLVGFRISRNGLPRFHV